jgi:hypothetical protein
MIYVDSLFEIGKSHNICDDYALSKTNEKFSLLIVSDGCSNSRSTDIGSRILAITAENFISENYETFMDIPVDDIAKTIVFKASASISSLCLSNESLDATLLICFVYMGEYRILKFGDGVSIIGKNNGTSEVISLSFENEYVYYLNYLSSFKRNEMFKEKHGIDKTITSGKYDQKEKTYEDSIIKSPMSDFYSATGKIEDISYIMIGTDGLFSCTSEVKNSFVGFLDIKNSKGVFVKRRFNAWKKNLFKNGINHDDDIAVAGMSFLRDKE